MPRRHARHTGRHTRPAAPGWIAVAATALAGACTIGMWRLTGPLHTDAEIVFTIAAIVAVTISVSVLRSSWRDETEHG